MDAVRNLKANPKLADKPCGWCQSALALGDDTSVCTSCEKAHHQRCWESKGGCSTAGCANAPLRQLDPPAVATAAALDAAALADGLMRCPSCRMSISADSQICPMCRAITSPDGIYHGPQITAPGSSAALVYAIIGFFICGVVLGPVAISKSSSVKQAIKS